MNRIERGGVVIWNDAPETEDVRAAMLRGLRSTPKTLPSKLFYDAVGSDLFEQITEQPEYYVTKTEIGIMQAFGSEIAAEMGPRARVVEFGSGASVKTRELLSDLDSPAAYVPIEISPEAVADASSELAEAFPDIEILPLVADYSCDLSLPQGEAEHATTVVYFPGSTIGNLPQGAAVDLMKRMRNIAGDDGRVLIGFDLRKDIGVLEAAYNDAAGVTAKFNLNLLTRIRDELGGSVDVDGFRHQAVWVPEPGRIEMQLISLREQSITIDHETFEFTEGEIITTEYSHKYTRELIEEMGAASGLSLRQLWTDDGERFAVVAFAAV